MGLDKEITDIDKKMAQLIKGAERKTAEKYAALLTKTKALLAKQYSDFEKNGVLSLQEMLKNDRLKKMMKQLDFLLKPHYKSINTDIQEALKQTYKTGFGDVIEAISKESKRKIGNSTATPETLTAMTKNPVAGLTLNERLERMRVKIIDVIQRQITQGLQENETYATMAKRLKGELEGDATKAMRIVRTEGHRVQESAKFDAAERATDNGVIMMKEWNTMEDGVVRRKPKSLADHKKLNGKKIATNELFNDGLSAGLAPGQLPAAGSSINCRCFLTYSIERLEKQKPVEAEPDKLEEKEPSKELIDIALKSTDGMDMFSSLEDPKLMAEVKGMMAGLEGKSIQKLNKIHADLIKGRKIEEYSPDSKVKMDAFDVGEQLIKPKEIEIKDRTDGRTALASAPNGSQIQVHADFWEMDEELQNYTIAHETGHIVSNAFPNLERHILENPEGALGRINQKIGKFEGVNNTWTPEESFADSFSLYHTDPDWLKEKHPKAYEFIDVVLNKVPDASLFYDEAMQALKKRKEPNKKIKLIAAKDIKTHDDAVKWGKDNNIIVDLNTLPIEVTKGIVGRVEKTVNRFPILKEYLREVVDSGQLGGFGGEYAHALGKGVSFNPKVWSKGLANVEKHYEKDKISGFHVKNTDALSIVTHELGHTLENVLTWQGTTREKGFINDPEYAKNIRKKVLKDLKIKVGNIESNLSRYAKMNPGEFFAEAFSEWLDSPNPRPIALAVGAEIERIIKEVEEIQRQKAKGLIK